MDIIAGTQATLAKDTMNDLARFRYRVFVEMLGWDLEDLITRTILAMREVPGC